MIVSIVKPPNTVVSICVVAVQVCALPCVIDRTDKRHVASVLAQAIGRPQASCVHYNLESMKAYHLLRMCSRCTGHMLHEY